MDWLLLIVAATVLLFGFVVFVGSPYVPSLSMDIRQAFRDLYPLTVNDLLVDIGSGDGVVLREAADLGARAVGYEINPILVLVSRYLSRKHKQIKINFANFWASHLPDDTTVVYVFSATRDTTKIIKKLQIETNQINRPINVISYGSKFDGLKIAKNVGAYHLYILYPRS